MDETLLRRVSYGYGKLAAVPYLDVNGARLNYHETGDGPVALFIHGFPFDSTMWKELTEDLAGLRRCIAVDLRGFGDSDRSTRQALTMEDHADDLAVFLKKASVVADVDVVGLSMGGYVALAFAQRYPDHVRSLALLDTKATADSEETKAGRDVAATLAVREGRTAFANSMMDAWVADQASTWVRGRLRTMIEATPVESIVAGLEGMKLRPDRTQVLAHAQVPVAVIVGDQDRLVTIEESQQMAEVARASLTVIPGAGHMAPIEQPAAVVSALRGFWLTA
jgi:3-oxoadipate enol-lactonase